MNKLRLDIERFHYLNGHLEPVSNLELLIYCFHPRIVPVVVLRLSEFFYIYHLGILARLCTLLNVVFFGIEVSPRVKIGGGLFLPHTVGTVIGADVIGENVTIMQGATLGAKEIDIHFTALSRPVIGDHVLIGAGAKIIGRVTVGDHVRIGANAVVLVDVPAHALAVGVPARVVISEPSNESSM